MKKKIWHEEPLLVIKGQISRCALGYHVKIPSEIVKLLNLEGTEFRVTLFLLKYPETRKKIIRASLVNRQDLEILIETEKIINVLQQVSTFKQNDEESYSYLEEE